MAPPQKIKDPSYENPYIDPLSGKQDQSVGSTLKETFAPTVKQYTKKDLAQVKAEIRAERLKKQEQSKQPRRKLREKAEADVIAKQEKGKQKGLMYNETFKTKGDNFHKDYWKGDRKFKVIAEQTSTKTERGSFKVKFYDDNSIKYVKKSVTSFTKGGTPVVHMMHVVAKETSASARAPEVGCTDPGDFDKHTTFSGAKETSASARAPKVGGTDPGDFDKNTTFSRGTSSRPIGGRYIAPKKTSNTHEGHKGRDAVVHRNLHDIHNHYGNKGPRKPEILNPQYFDRYKSLRQNVNHYNWDVMKDPGGGQNWSRWSTQRLMKYEHDDLAQFGLSHEQNQLWWTLHAHGLHRFGHNQMVFFKYKGRYVQGTVKDYKDNREIEHTTSVSRTPKQGERCSMTRVNKLYSMIRPETTCMETNHGSQIISGQVTMNY